MKKRSFIAMILSVTVLSTFAQQKRFRDYGWEIGVLKPGRYNAITDVEGVTVGHTTLKIGDSVRTGVTAILPHSGNIFQQKVPAAIYIGNGFGKLAGYSQVRELGNIETPIILTNTLSVPIASDALITHTLGLPGNEQIRSVNAIVGETNDGYLNDIRGRHITQQHVVEAITKARTGPVSEGNVGAVTGTVCFGYKGGIGTSSRVVPKAFGGYTVGVLVQTNFGGVLEINGVPIAKTLDNYPKSYKYNVDGSCMIIVMTDAPLDARNLERLAKRAMMGLAKTGGIASNGSGDYVIAVSTSKKNRIPYADTSLYHTTETLRNEAISPLFLATIEATEEAIINSLFAAKTTIGRDGNRIEALPIDQAIEILEAYQVSKR